MHYFLGIDANKTIAGTIQLSQTKYIKDLLKKAGMTGVEAMPTSMMSN